MAKGIGGQVPRLHGYTWSDIPERDQDEIKAGAAEAGRVQFFEDLPPDVRREVREKGAAEYWRHHS